MHLLINGTVGVAKQFDAVGLNHQAADREICNLKEELQELRVLKDGVSAALVGATSNGAADNKQVSAIMQLHELQVRVHSNAARTLVSPSWRWIALCLIVASIAWCLRFSLQELGFLAL